MQLLGLILLVASSWYLWKLTSNFLDEPTKKELSNSFNNLKNKFQESKQILSLLERAPPSSLYFSQASLIFSFEKLCLLS